MILWTIWAFGLGFIIGSEWMNFRAWTTWYVRVMKWSREWKP